MNPQQTPAPPYNPDPYRFIMEPPKIKAPRASKGVSGNPFIMRLILIIGGAVVLMIVVGIVLNTFFATKTNITDIVDLVETQQELIRVAANGTRASSSPVKNAAVSTELSLTTQQQDWFTFLQKNGRKVAGKELSLKKNAATDTQLTNALATSTYDSTLTQLMRNQLTSYAAAIQDAYKNSTSASEKKLLSKDYAQVQLLLKQWPATATDS